LLLIVSNATHFQQKTVPFFLASVQLAIKSTSVVCGLHRSRTSTGPTPSLSSQKTQQQLHTMPKTE
jgi:hypothetical protein